MAQQPKNINIKSKSNRPIKGVATAKATIKRTTRKSGVK